MLRIDICAADDHETQARLQAVLRELGIIADDTWHDEPGFGTGLTRYRLGDQELTVFKDAWVVDLAGPDELVNRVLATMSGPAS
ncbi:MAG: hypothetical protein ABGY75_05710 [Gemmataceae bacterium]